MSRRVWARIGFSTYEATEPAPSEYTIVDYARSFALAGRIDEAPIGDHPDEGVPMPSRAKRCLLTVGATWGENRRLIMRLQRRRNLSPEHLAEARQRALGVLARLRRIRHRRGRSRCRAPAAICGCRGAGGATAAREQLCVTPELMPRVRLALLCQFPLQSLPVAAVRTNG